MDLDGSHELQTCYGDVLKTINALMDYTRMLDIICDQWELSFLVFQLFFLCFLPAADSERQCILAHITVWLFPGFLFPAFFQSVRTLWTKPSR